MSVAIELRSFILSFCDPITVVTQNFVDESVDIDTGCVWFRRSSTSRPKTFGQSTGIAEEQFFDVEIYHADPDIVEQVADAFAGRDGYRGEFGVGIVQGFFVDSQADDYVPGIEFTDADNVHSAFIQVEVRQFAAP